MQSPVSAAKTRTRSRKHQGPQAYSGVACDPRMCQTQPMRNKPKLVLCFLLAAAASARAQKIDQLYATHCAACHGANFEGGVGGSLIDGEWKHGSSDEEIRLSIAKGKPEMGMVPWEEVLKPDQIRAMVILLREKEKGFLAKSIKYPVPSPGEITKTELHSYRIETVVKDGLRTPWAIEFLPDGTKLVTERPGRLRVIDRAGRLLPQAVRDIPKSTELGQGGLMDVAIHPDFKRNGWIYLALSDGEMRKGPDGKPKPACITAIARGRIKDNRWTDNEWIYRPDPSFRSHAGVHFGSRIVFGGGYVWFVIGERGGMMEAQDLSRPNGKIFRLHDDGRVPVDNPFVKTSGAIPGIWSYGHRNPQGMIRDPRDGSIYATEHGPRGGDELNLILPGKNYGWPVITYGMNYSGTPMVAITAKEGMEQPLTFWVPSIAACGLEICSGKGFPRWKGDLLAGGLAQKEVRRIRLKDKKVVAQEVILKNIGRVRAVSESPDGSIYVVLNGPDRIVRIRSAD